MGKTELRIGGVPLEDPSKNEGVTASEPAAQGGEKTLQEKVTDVLRTVYDPEVPVDIYELGLIYGINIDSQNNVHIQMTLTSPACPVAESMPGEVRAVVGRIPEVNECEIELVWDPPWGPARMSEVAKLKLGML